MGKGTDYTVDSKEELRKLSKAGEVETWYRIYATSKGGTYFHVDVREEELDKADALLTARAKELDAI
ncbi:hypothetical protein ES708_09262 [subsurface metagenome]|uniref:Uncharacterized protein n=1 Tax=marine sediment metagenome TaxID=412755 RepID=X1TGC6_9ZZZZ